MNTLKDPKDPETAFTYSANTRWELNYSCNICGHTDLPDKDLFQELHSQMKIYSAHLNSEGCLDFRSSADNGYRTSSLWQYE